MERKFKITGVTSKFKKEDEVYFLIEGILEGAYFLGKSTVKNIYVEATEWKSIVENNSVEIKYDMLYDLSGPPCSQIAEDIFEECEEKYLYFEKEYLMQEVKSIFAKCDSNTLNMYISNNCESFLVFYMDCEPHETSDELVTFDLLKKYVNKL